MIPSKLAPPFDPHPPFGLHACAMCPRLFFRIGIPPRSAWGCDLKGGRGTRKMSRRCSGSCMAHLMDYGQWCTSKKAHSTFSGVRSLTSFSDSSHASDEKYSVLDTREQIDKDFHQVSHGSRNMNRPTHTEKGMLNTGKIIYL